MFLNDINRIGIIPVFCPNNEAELTTFANGVYNGGVRAVEITLRSEFAIKAIPYLKQNFPDLTVGAGTILNLELLVKAVEAGADFLVSPGYTESLIDKANFLNVPFIPGCCTPSEIQNAYAKNLNVIKYFPAELSGGTAALKLYASAFPKITFIPTGGITLNNVADYLAMPNVLACGGSFMLPRNALATGDVSTITKTVKNCVREGVL